MARRFPLDQLTLANYAETFRLVPFSRYFLNSTIVTVSVTVLQILISSLAAFAFARLRFRGREALFLLYLATLMIPAGDLFAGAKDLRPRHYAHRHGRTVSDYRSRRQRQNRESGCGEVQLAEMR